MDLSKAISIALILCLLTEVKCKHHLKRETMSSICDPASNTYKIKCFSCTTDPSSSVKTANCGLLAELEADDPAWQALDSLKNLTKLTLSNNGVISLKYIPTYGIKNLNLLRVFEIKSNKIQRVQTNAFTSLNRVEKITLRNNQIQTLEKNAFNSLTAVTIIELDKNNIVEINRDVFINLPSLEKLFLTDNNITTIHDRAFVHLTNLKELEINMNSLFSLNNETFFGLTNLQRLDLSGNALEVIGDNTFLPLSNLKYLDLSSNKIEMVDEKAFNGLHQLQQLSLSRNKLKTLDNAKTFESLNSLISLNLKGNELVELKPEVMKPIIKKFYGATSQLDVLENKFPCDCRLDWTLPIINKTENKRLKTSLENLKCLPDFTLRELWNKTLEIESEPPIDEKEIVAEDYEYYDESQMNGQLFYVDVRFLLNCTNPVLNETSTTLVIPNIETKPKTTEAVSYTTEYKITKVTNQGTLSLDETTETDRSTHKTTTTDKNVRNDVGSNEKTATYTTIMATTVSARPDDPMSADEAKPDNGYKTYRSVKEDMVHQTGNSAYRIYVTKLTLLILSVMLV